MNEALRFAALPVVAGVILWAGFWWWAISGMVEVYGQVKAFAVRSRGNP